jgi:peptidoglycan/xylan/chitin deacetylase (PgdA/CDA1 family)
MMGQKRELPMTPAQDLHARPDRPIPILMYHQFAALPAHGVPCRDLVTTPEHFARQMGLLASLGYRALSMADLEPYLRGEATGRVVGLTMDDGYLNCFENALPVLHTHGFTATCYVVSSQVGGTNAWDHPEGVPPQPMMTREHLREWIAAGHEIGGHTRSHVRLMRIDDARACEEIHGCKRELEDLLGQEVRNFSYPYGEYFAQHVAMVREAGFRTATTNVAQRATRHDSSHTLPRFTMLNDTDLLTLWRRVAFGTEDLRHWLRSARRLRQVQPASHAGA